MEATYSHADVGEFSFSPFQQELRRLFAVAYKPRLFVNSIQANTTTPPIGSIFSHQIWARRQFWKNAGNGPSDSWALGLLVHIF